MVHLGQNIAKLRAMKRIAQKEMASKLNLSQPEYSRLEQKVKIGDDVLERIAAALEIPVDIIKEFKEEAIFTNNVYEQNNSISQVYFQNNPVEKIIELYERLLNAEKTIKEKEEIIERLQKKEM